MFLWISNFLAIDACSAKKANLLSDLIKKKSVKHLNVIDNTINTLIRLDVKFNVDDIRKFLFSTRFIFQNLDRVIFFDNDLNIVGDTDTLDLDPRSFSTRLDEIEFESLNNNENDKNNTCLLYTSPSPRD